MSEETKQPFKSKIGGQALIEGIMMRGIDTSAMACRLPDGTIDVETWKIRNGKTAPWYTKTPFIRGCFNFGVSLWDGLKCTMKSAQKQVTDDEEEDDPEEMNRFERWLSTKLEGEHGKEIMNTIMLVVCIAAMVIAVCVFKFVPAALSSLLKYAGAPTWTKAVSEGLIKIIMLVGYMWAISNMGEIHTTFMYHGAEHKTIFCYENGLELTVENVRKQPRFHPRCGTSFIFIVVLLSVCVGMFLPWSNVWLRFGLQLLLLPVEASVGYELIRLAGRFDNLFTRIISAPGMWLQRITTKEPTDKMIEVAIAALTPCIPEDKSDDKW
ncbi:MAG: DUF1385 domain-containing protein [Oscillospiraceae bacterium]